MTAFRLLLVGKRQGALAAARRLDAEVLLMDDAAPSANLRKRVDGFVRVDFADGARCVAAARRLLGRRAPDAVVAVVERGVLPAAAIRDAMNVNGASLQRALRWRDKLAMKDAVRAHGIACANTRTVDRTTRADRLVTELGLPLVLKPRASSGGRGTRIVHELRDLDEALLDGWLAESFVHGTEVSVESLVQDGRVCFENVTEYLRPGWANVVPAELPPAVDRAVRELNRKAIEALDVRDGLTHLEAFVEPGAGDPQVVFGELACRPPGGFLMELLRDAYGFDPWASHLAVELGREIDPPPAASVSAGVYFLHPGEGRVVAIDGLEQAREVPGVVRIECTIEVGHVVARREGVGQHTGRIIVHTGCRDDTAKALEAANRCILFRTEPRAA